ATGGLIALASLGFTHPSSVVMLNPRTGGTIHATRLPLPLGLAAALGGSLSSGGPVGTDGIALDARLHRLFAATRLTYQVGSTTYPDTALSMIDLRTGALRRTIYLPNVPNAVAL